MAVSSFTIPKSLTDALHAGTVVPFIGAGASVSVKKANPDGSPSNEALFPDWKGFVKILADRLNDEGKPDEADFIRSSVKIKNPKYLEALEHARQELGEGLWHQLFDKCFNKSKKEAATASFKLYELVWQLSNNLIITTNVDRVLQWTAPDPADFKILDVQHADYAQLQKEHFPTRPTGWYLHGHIDHKEQVIFTRTQFENFYKANNNDAKLQTLLNFLTRRTFLFIGYSLNDAYLREQLEYIHHIYGGAADSYFILLHEDEIAKANLPAYVRAIPFPDFGKPLEKLLEELVKVKKKL